MEYKRFDHNISLAHHKHFGIEEHRAHPEYAQGADVIGQGRDGPRQAAQVRSIASTG